MADHPLVRHLVVAVPARDEEELLAACLGSIAAAGAALHRARRAGGAPPVRVDVVLALDGCTDGSLAVARRHGVHVVETDAAVVGAARRAAVEAGLARAAAAGSAPEATWACCTDADSTVPSAWLVRHVEIADAGADLAVGTVCPTDGGDPGLLSAWRRHHRLREGHPYVHGANLGLRASAYRTVGGFRPLAVHEDVDLVRRVQAAGRPWVATDRTRVRTSDRTRGRARDGFAAYLAALALERPGA